MRVKYPRTPHLPWSPGATADDVRILDTAAFEGREVVVTEKLDGENTSLYRTGLHARSLDSGHHPSRAWVKALHARIAPEIPEGHRICGENLAARHSIPYDQLLSYFYGFGVWDGPRCLAWDPTVALLDRLGIPTPPVLYRGPWDVRAIRGLRVPAERRRREGYVVRTVEGFDLADFGRRCAKWVRPHHVRTDAHWMLQEMVPNGLAPEAALWEVRSGGAIDAGALWALLDLPGEPGAALDLGGTGPERLELALASLLPPGAPAERLPHLAHRLPVRLAVRVHHLCALHGRLRHPVDDATRPGGLASLARSCDLRALHALAERDATGEALEQVRWSRLVAEDAGLLEPDAVDRWVAGLRAALPPLEEDAWAFVRGEALAARSAGGVRGPEDAAARAWPDLRRAPKRLTVLVGPSGAGKSTVAERLGGRVVGLDRLREAGAGDAEALRRGLAALDRALSEHPAAVWDATSLSPSQRALPLAVAARHRAVVRLVGVLTRRQTAARRNRQRARTVPDEVVRRQWARLRWPAAHEAHRLAWVTEDGGLHADD